MEEALDKSSGRGIMTNIEFLRIIFTIAILDCHFIGKLELWSSAHQAVGFFFILSGFFLAKTFSPNKSMLQFIKNSFIRFSPLILLGACLRCFFMSSIKLEGLLSEVFLVSTTGIYDERPYNAVSWYISVLFWVSLLYIYLLKTRKRETVNLVLSLIAFLGIIGLNKRGFSILRYLGNNGDIGYLFEMTLIYGLALVAVGYFAWLIYEQVRSRIEPTRWRIIVFTFLEAAVLAYSIAMMHFKSISINNFAFISMIFASLIVLFSLKIGYVSRLLERNIWIKPAKYCLAVYLTQSVVMWGIFPYYLRGYREIFFEHKCLTILGVFILCCVLGIWAHHVVEKPCARFLRRILSNS